MLTHLFKNRFIDYETKSFLIFFLLCRYRFEKYSHKQIISHQQKRMNYIVDYAINHSNFYKEHYKSIDMNNSQSLPTINKKIMMDNIGEFNTVGLSKSEILDFCLEVEENRDFTKRLKGYSIGMSSGTSGNKGVEIISREEEGYMRAALLARFDRPKGEKLNIAFILRVSSPALNLDKFGHKVTYLSLFESLDNINRELSQIQPNVLAAPPTMLKLIAQNVDQGKLKIYPKRIVTYVEVIDPRDREYISKIFGVPVHEIYKATEAPIAITCRLGNLHINEDLVLVELLNKDGSECQPGNPSFRMIVTDLYKKSQPIIRYELNDIITIDPNNCSCGSSFRLIQRIQGRSDDLFIGKNTSTGVLVHIFPDQIRRAVIKSSEDIAEYSVRQTSLTSIKVYLELEKVNSEDDFEKDLVIENIQKIFHTKGLSKPEVDIIFTEDINQNKGNKFIRIRREFDYE